MKINHQKIQTTRRSHASRCHHCHHCNGFVLFHNVTCHNKSLSSCIHVNNVTSLISHALCLPTCMILGRLECSVMRYMHIQSHLIRMTKTLSMVSNKNYNLNALEGFIIFLTSKLITCFIDGLTLKIKTQLVSYLLNETIHIYIEFQTLKMKST
jgi:hypothetical protein